MVEWNTRMEYWNGLIYAKNNIWMSDKDYQQGYQFARRGVICSLATTVYHESFEAEKFAVFVLFAVRETFLYEGSRCCCSNMDLRESMREGLHVQLAAKLFCLEIFMIYVIGYI